jgi:hypothetical protein
LLDSNIVIYAALPEHGMLRSFIAENPSCVSIVTRIEVLGYHRLTPWERGLFEQLFDAATVVPLSDDIAERAIELRSKRKMSLGDSIIAATALVLQLTLVTHNTEDFLATPGLTLLDPLGPDTSSEAAPAE